MKNHPEVSEEEYTIITVPTSQIYGQEAGTGGSGNNATQLTRGASQDDDAENKKPAKPIFSLMKFPIVSACVGKESKNCEEKKSKNLKNLENLKIIEKFLKKSKKLKFFS